MKFVPKKFPGRHPRVLAATLGALFAAGLLSACNKPADPAAPPPSDTTAPGQTTPPTETPPGELPPPATDMPPNDMPPSNPQPADPNAPPPPADQHTPPKQ